MSSINIAFSFKSGGINVDAVKLILSRTFSDQIVLKNASIYFYYGVQMIKKSCVNILLWKKALKSDSTDIVALKGSVSLFLFVFYSYTLISGLKGSSLVESNTSSKLFVS